jgi:hypothetical protein
VVLVPIVALTVVMGMWPNLFLAPIAPSVERVLNQVRDGAHIESGPASMRYPRRAERPDDVGSFSAIVPMACVTAAAIAAMVAEAFRILASGCRSRRWGHRPRRRRHRVAALVEFERHELRSGHRRQFGVFVTLVLVVIGLLSLALSAPTIDRLQLPRGEYFALMLFSIAGMM